LAFGVFGSSNLPVPHRLLDSDRLPVEVPAFETEQLSGSNPACGEEHAGHLQTAARGLHDPLNLRPGERRPALLRWIN